MANFMFCFHSLKKNEFREIWYRMLNIQVYASEEKEGSSPVFRLRNILYKKTTKLSRPQHSVWGRQWNTVP